MGFEIKKHHSGFFHWHLRSANNRILGESRPYKTLEGAFAGVWAAHYAATGTKRGPNDGMHIPIHKNCH